METLLLTVVILLMLAVLALLVWLISSILSNRRDMAGQAASMEFLQKQLETVKLNQDSTKQSLENSLKENQNSLTQSLQASQKVLGQLNSQIGELHGTNKQMMQVATDVRRLQDILSSPKLRGNMGEWSLKNLLENVLPKDSYKLQHCFKSGKIVDCLILMPGYSVPVDAKFPLSSFEKMALTNDDAEKLKMRRQFQRDVITHIDKIADNYILPAEGTLDFAKMYIPAENVYYETIIKYDGDAKDVLQYALERKVIPVSPSLLYSYLMTIVMGLHGLQIEKQAAEIRQNLNKLNSDFASFTSTWDTLGNHIRNTSNKYDEANKKLDRFGLNLTQIQQVEENTKQIGSD